MQKHAQTKHPVGRIRDLDTLPPLGRQAQRLLSALGDPELDTVKLVALLRQSPALAARILGIARSAFFAGTLPPRDLEDAVIRFLGLRLVRDLAIAFTLASPLRTDQCGAFQSLRYWRHALLTASLAESLANGARIPNVDQAYLSGLLHSLGLLALVHVAPAQMHRAFLELNRTGHPPLSTLEQEQVGLDHCAAGRLLAEAWGLPPEIADVMAFHRDIHYRGRHRELVLLTALAERQCAETDSGLPQAEEALKLLLEELGISPSNWPRLLGRWLPSAQRITELAGQFQ